LSLYHKLSRHIIQLISQKIVTAWFCGGKHTFPNLRIRRTPVTLYARATMTEHIVIIGAGITGLATAMVLSPIYKITIIARDLPGDLGTSWASPWFVSEAS